MATPIGFLDSWTCRFGVEGLDSAQLDASPVLDSFPPEGIMFCDEDGRQIRLDRASIERIMSCTWACYLLLEDQRLLAEREFWAFPPPVSPSTPFGNGLSSAAFYLSCLDPVRRVRAPTADLPAASMDFADIEEVLPHRRPRGAVYEVTSASEWILKMGTRIREPAIIWGQLKFTYGHLFIVFCGLFVLSSTMYMLYSADSQSRKIKSASARHILMQSEADILQAKARIEGGESFSRVAKALSQCKSAVDGGDLGVFQPGELHPSFDRVVFNRSNPIGQVLGPVKTKFGWHLFRVEYRTGFNESNDSFDEPLGDGPLVQSEGRLDLSRSFVGWLNSFRCMGSGKKSLVTCPDVPSSVDAGCDEMLRCGDFLYESVFVRRIGVVDGVDIGLGLFTRRAVAKGTFLGEYVGVMTRRTCEEDGVYGFSLPVVDPDLVVDAKKFGNLCRLINHSDDDWNAELMSVHHEGLLHVMCRATRDLMPEEQVFIHYGKRYWMPEARRCVRLGCAPDT
ncbi:ppiC [Symbiodinium sp. KB8]|nr:ppiC [Symbiodinium sp. KB8]